MGLIKLV